MPHAGDRVGAPEINIGGVAVIGVAIEGLLREWVGGCPYAREVTLLDTACASPGRSQESTTEGARLAVTG